MHLSILTKQNCDRRNRWHTGGIPWTGSDWAVAMAGECGEACNLVKKLRRHETQIESTYNTPVKDDLLTMLADEIADTIIYADLLASHYGIDTEAAVVEKFNRVSAAQGFPERLPEKRTGTDGTDGTDGS